MRRQEPGEPLQKTEPGRRPHRHKAAPKAGPRPADAALLQAAPSEGPGSARSCRLDKGASPALLTGTRACSWRQRAPHKVVTRAPSTGPARLAGHQRDWQPRSIGRDPDPGYRWVPVPTLPLSGFAPSSKSKGEAGLFLHPGVLWGRPYGHNRAPLSLLGHLNHTALFLKGA